MPARSRWRARLPPPTGLGHPLPRPRPPVARCPHATLSLNCANICCAPTVSQSRASLPPPPPHLSPATRPCRPARPVGFVTAAAEAQAPRERPERSRRMAGSDTGLPCGSRGNGGWRPLKRDRSRPAELAELGRRGGRTPGRICLPVSEACRSPHSIALGSAWTGTPPGSARLGRGWLRCPLPQYG